MIVHLKDWYTHTHTLPRMVANIRFVPTNRPANWGAIDQLAQIKAKIGEQTVHYFLYWHTEANMVLVQRDIGNDGPCYWACGKLSIADMLTHFHDVLHINITEAWASRGEADVNTIADIHFVTIRNRHHVVSLDCEA